MNKQEFLEKLRLALNGRVSAGAVADNISYYEDYINTEQRKGRTEEEIMQQLGDPRLIARTIIETSGRDASAAEQAEETGHFGYENGRAGENAVRKSWADRIPGWLWLILFLVIAVLILSAVFHVIAFFAPAILVVAVVLFFVKLFRDWLN